MGQCNGFYYTIRRGDTLFFLARRFGITLQQLIDANPQISNPNVLQIGQVICVPRQQPPAPPDCPGGTIYTVQSGDTLFIIANNFGIPLNDLIAANPQIVNPNQISVGQQVCVPAVPGPPLCHNGFLYTVQPGDTIYLLSQRFGITQQQILDANPQVTNPDLIIAGQQLCIPTF